MFTLGYEKEQESSSHCCKMPTVLYLPLQLVVSIHHCIHMTYIILLLRTLYIHVYAGAHNENQKLVCNQVLTHIDMYHHYLLTSSSSSAILAAMSLCILQEEDPHKTSVMCTHRANSHPHIPSSCPSSVIKPLSDPLALYLS